MGDRKIPIFLSRIFLSNGCHGVVRLGPVNDPSSATRRTRACDGNRSAMARRCSAWRPRLHGYSGAPPPDADA